MNVYFYLTILMTYLLAISKDIVITHKSFLKIYDQLIHFKTAYFSPQKYIYSFDILTFCSFNLKHDTFF